MIIIQMYLYTKLHNVCLAQLSLFVSQLCMRVSLLLHLIIINCSNLPSVRRHLSGVNTFPTMLNNLSMGAEDEGTPKMSLASLDKFDNFFDFLAKT